MFRLERNSTWHIAKNCMRILCRRNDRTIAKRRAICLKWFFKALDGERRCGMYCRPHRHSRLYLYYRENADSGDIRIITNAITISRDRAEAIAPHIFPALKLLSLCVISQSSEWRQNIHICCCCCCPFFVFLAYSKCAFKLFW